MVGVKSEDGSDKIQKIMKNEVLLVNVGSTSTGGRILNTNSKYSTVTIQMMSPVCTNIGEKIALSRRISKNWRLIGWGKINSGKVIYSDDNKEKE